MKRHFTAVLATLAISLALTGCLGGRVKYPAYYTLQVPPPPESPPTETARPSLAVQELHRRGTCVKEPSHTASHRSRSGSTTTIAGR